MRRYSKVVRTSLVQIAENGADVAIWWSLALACGHVAWRPRYAGARRQKAPRRVLCDERRCSEARPRPLLRVV